MFVSTFRANHVLVPNVTVGARPSLCLVSQHIAPSDLEQETPCVGNEPQWRKRLEAVGGIGSLPFPSMTEGNLAQRHL